MISADRKDYVEQKRNIFFNQIAPHEFQLVAQLLAEQVDGNEDGDFLLEAVNQESGDVIVTYMVKCTKTRWTVSRIGLRKRNEFLRHEKEKAAGKKSNS